MNRPHRSLVDRIAVALAARSARRSVIAAVAASFGKTGARPAEAIGDDVCKAANPREFVSRQACETLACGSAPGCVCAQTVGHKPVCVAGFDPADPRCPRRDQCSSKRPCIGGRVCAKTQVCCGREVRTCLRRCPA